MNEQEALSSHNVIASETVKTDRLSLHGTDTIGDDPPLRDQGALHVATSTKDRDLKTSQKYDDTRVSERSGLPSNTAIVDGRGDG